jgi:hypothetical protein
MIEPSELEIDLSTIEIAIDKAVEFLSQNQLSDGEFKTYGSLIDNPEGDCHFDSSLFVTSLVVYALSFRANLKIQVIQDKALDFLAEQMESAGVWRYWSSKNSMRRFIPPDLDDTCCISFVLKKYRTAPANHHLILANRNQKGLFYTWMLPRLPLLFGFPLFWLTSFLAMPFYLVLFRTTEARMDNIDCGVNANVILYLGETKETKKVVDYLSDIIISGQERERDSWYLSSLPHYYFLSRAYFNGVRRLEVVRPKILANLEQLLENGADNNPLDTALAICTLLNFGQVTPTLRSAISFLIKRQETDGDWARIPFYFGGPKGIYGFGSSELTTAFCIEALVRYQEIESSRLTSLDR